MHYARTKALKKDGLEFRFRAEGQIPKYLRELAIDEKTIFKECADGVHYAIYRHHPEYEAGRYASMCLTHKFIEGHFNNMVCNKPITQHTFREYSQPSFKHKTTCKSQSTKTATNQRKLSGASK